MKSNFGGRFVWKCSHDYYYYWNYWLKIDFEFVNYFLINNNRKFHNGAGLSVSKLSLLITKSSMISWIYSRFDFLFLLCYTVLCIKFCNNFYLWFYLSNPKKKEQTNFGWFTQWELRTTQIYEVKTWIITYLD